MRQALTRECEGELRTVERALQDIADGHCGRCRRGGEDITVARRQARPRAAFCVSCSAH